MDMIFDGYAAITSTENHIKQLHGVLLKYSAKDQDHRGDYKKVTNNVEAFGPDGKSIGVVFETATPFETPGWMKELVDWFNRSDRGGDPSSPDPDRDFLVVFLAIHPFKDGNGRLSRVLTTLLLLRAGYGYVPYSSMEGVIEQNKDSYYLALRRTQQTIRKEEAGLGALVGVFPQNDGQAKRQPRPQGEGGAGAPRILARPFPPDTGIAQNTRRDHGGKEIEDSSGANRNTIKVHLKNLVEQNYLTQLGKTRGARYTLKQA